PRARHQGLQQIDEALAQVNGQLRRPGLPLIDWLYWSGRRRELRTARWLVQQLLPVEVLVIPEPGPESSRDRQDFTRSRWREACLRCLRRHPR
ncbi:MAG: hypothetical protein HC890_20225, partial [Chloroflexaceae bacterium]|nr:hypothetical protein [Chloroflexaceae bacterium]